MREGSESSQDYGTTRPSGVGVSGAVRAAVVLALLSVLPVAWSFLLAPPEWVQVNSGFVQGPIDWQPIAPLTAIVLALVVVLLSAVAGGLIGGLVWRWRRLAGAAVALASAWATGIVTLPMAAAALGAHLRTGIVCVMGCESLLRDDRPLGGPLAYGYFVAGTFVFLWSLVLPILIGLILIRVLFAWVRGRPSTRPRPPLIPSFIAFAAAHGIALLWTINTGIPALVPYVALSAGVIAWAAWLDRNDGSVLDALRRALIIAR